MLVITRKVGEKMVTGDGSTIHVLSIGQGKVKLGFEGPLRVYRTEIAKDRIHGDGTTPVTQTTEGV
jgi:carbon storage regulator CsrA